MIITALKSFCTSKVDKGSGGFWGGAPTPKGRAPIYYLAKFHRKLHENEENWTGGVHPKILLCRSATEGCIRN